jgi:small GTP-binding protein
MLGSFSVGKTSLVRRYVEGVFSDKYLTTIGVKVDKKLVRAKDTDVTLMLWDLAGEDDFYHLRSSYLRGSSAYLLVADGTRRNTLDKAIELKNRADAVLGKVPFCLALNKADIKDEWELDVEVLDRLVEAGWPVLETSAKWGTNVNDMFLFLTEKLLQVPPES